MADNQPAFEDEYRRVRTERKYPPSDARETQAYNTLFNLRAYPNNIPQYTQQRQQVIQGLNQNILTDPRVGPAWERFMRQKYDYTPAEAEDLRTRGTQPSPPNASSTAVPLFYISPVVPAEVVSLMLSSSGQTGAGEEMEMGNIGPFRLEYVQRALFPHLSGIFRQLAESIQIPPERYIETLERAIEQLADRGAGATTARKIAYETLSVALQRSLSAVQGDEQLMARVDYVVQELEQVRLTLQDTASPQE